MSEYGGVFGDAYKQGYAKAIEDAAKVCDKPVDEPLVSRIPGYVLAARIRALLAKGVAK